MGHREQPVALPALPPGQTAAATAATTASESRSPHSTLRGCWVHKSPDHEDLATKMQMPLISGFGENPWQCGTETPDTF